MKIRRGPLVPDHVVVPGPNRKHLIVTLVAIVVVGAVIGFLYRGLSHPTDKDIPSVLLGKTARGFQVDWLQGQDLLGHATDPRGFSLADFKGRPLILNFWDTSCRGEALDLESSGRRTRIGASRFKIRLSVALQFTKPGT
ncbi:MAG TPA: hypothetical protein VE954_13520 [Oligoflexus sp.]|uniref:hypothetical protein n=1 Tax=Oligoflexus sp. TaxID=1971216 RepID=UPI002D4A419E|nr:hypothetical protein [Oligoflexus sp.]HYX34122.1 hypothetical protein [Oligoflexus sp.]